MIELGVNNLAKFYGVDKVFENVVFDIKSKEKVGLIGRNGTGKTTLLKILIGTENYQNGEIFKRKGIKIGYLEQVPEYPDDFIVKDVLSIAFSDIYDIKKKMEDLESTFDNLDTEQLDSAMKNYGKLQEEYQRLGGYEQEEKMSKITVGLNISNEMQNRKFNNLSGGEKSRIILGKILLEKPDVLLLDEPSNHLDMVSIEWLETYLKEYNGSVLIVSHDRYFLDRVVDRIIELENDGVQLYKGNYSHYVVEKEIRFLNALKEYKNQQKKIKKMEDQIERYRIWGKMRDSDKMFKRAKELEKRLEKIDRIDKPISEQKKVSFNNGNISRSGKEVFWVKNISKSFSGRRLLKNINFKVFYNDRLGILGENGTGKSTLIKLIMNDMVPDSGEIKIGSRIKIGYLAQEVNFENENISILDMFMDKYGTTRSDTRKELAKALFSGDDVFKLIRSLSGGEKSRLKLAMLMFEEVNVMVLDEPTNHLDIDSREVLEESLENFDGTIVFVSHDRYFVNKVASRIGEIQNGELKLYNYNYQGYKAEKERIRQNNIIESINKENIVKKKSKKDDYKKRNEKQKELSKLQRKLAKLEEQISNIEELITECENQMNETNIDVDKLNEIYSTNEKYKEELDTNYLEWEDLSKQIERLSVLC